LVIEKAGTLRAGGDVAAIAVAGHRRNVTLRRFSRWNVTLRRLAKPKDAWPASRLRFPGAVSSGRLSSGGLSPGRDVPAIAAAGYRRNVTFLRFSRWNVTLRRCRCR